MADLLMTRPRAASDRFIVQMPAQLRQRLTIVFSPLIGIEPLSVTPDLNGVAGLIFTSSNAVKIAAGLTNRRDLACYCVGQSTTSSAQELGWKASCFGQNADTLVATLSRAKPDGALLHLRGTHARGDIAARLTASGVPTLEQVIYNQPEQELSGQARAVLARKCPVIVPLFSPRTARQFVSQHSGDAPLYLAALSDAVAKPLAGLKYCELRVADTPDTPAILRIVEQLADQTARVEGDWRAQ